MRVVAATNRNLKAAVAARQYREDLYFRLSVFPITIPPLRERPDDIPMLARHFIERFCRDLNKKPLTLAPSALEQLQAYRVAGQRARAAELHRARGDPHRRRHDSRPPPESVGAGAAADGGSRAQWDDIDLSGTLAEADAAGRARGRAAEDRSGRSKQAGGDRAQAAEMLQVSYKVLIAKLREYGLD